MLTHRPLATCLLGAATLTIAVLSGCGATISAGPAGNRAPAATNPASPAVAPRSPSSTARPFPPEAYANLQPTHLHGLLSCQQPRHPSIEADPGIEPAQSLAALTRTSVLVVVARATEQKSYWHRAVIGHEFPGVDGWVPMTATEFSVEQVLKGSPTSYVTLVEEGARPGTLPCDGVSYVIEDQPLTQNGGEYVLFLQASGSLGDNMWRFSFPPYYRFDVGSDGQVRGEYSLPGYSPEPLATFVSQVRASMQQSTPPIP